MPRIKKITPENAVITSSSFELSKSEMDAILAAREKLATSKNEPNVGISELAQALITAIEATRPPAKKNPFNRKKGDPWQNKDGSPKSVLRRKMYQHGMELDAAQLFSEQIDLLNKIKPGRYCDGYVHVIKRKDGGLDVDYPIKTAAQRLKLVNNFGITSFTDLLKRILDEKAEPTKYRHTNDEDDD